MTKWDFWIDRGGTFTDIVAAGPRRPHPDPQTALGEPRAVQGRSAPGHPRPARPRGERPIPWPDRSTPSRWAPQSPPTRCSSARAPPPCSPSRAASAMPGGSATSTAPTSSPATSSSRELYTRTSRSTSACWPTAGRTPLDEAGARADLEAAYADGIRAVAIVLMHGYRHGPRSPRRPRSPATSASRRCRQPHRLAADEDRRPRRHHRGRCLPLAHPPPLCRPGRPRDRRRAGSCSCSPPAAWSTPQVPGQGRHPLRPGGRHRRHGQDRRIAGFDKIDRLRHGRHVHRRHPLCRRVRARLRDRGGRRPHARADDENPHRGRRRRVDHRLRRRSASASARRVPAPIPARPATAVADPWRSPTPT
jgi:hypothetical protein